MCVSSITVDSVATGEWVCRVPGGANTGTQIEVLAGIECEHGDVQPVAPVNDLGDDFTGLAGRLAGRIGISVWDTSRSCSGPCPRHVSGGRCWAAWRFPPTAHADRGFV